MQNLILCALALTELFGSSYISRNEKVGRGYPARLAACMEVVDVATELGVEPALMVAIGYVESKFNARVVSSAGAIGVLQIIPRWDCPGGKLKGCDQIRAGVNAIRKLVVKHGGNLKLVLCHYNSGNVCTNLSKRRYTPAVLRRRHRLLIQSAAIDKMTHP